MDVLRNTLPCTHCELVANYNMFPLELRRVLIAITIIVLIESLNALEMRENRDTSRRISIDSKGCFSFDKEWHFDPRYLKIHAA